MPVLLPENTSPAFNGLINVRVQQDTGSPFATSATVTLRSADMTINLDESHERIRTNGL